VTLEVSKLSGWLNADAPCRESKGGHAVWSEVRPGRREAAGDGCTQRAGAGSSADSGQGRGKERTWNIWFMVVTLEVSKLSGWLNACAPCREPKGGHTVRGEGAGQQTG